MADDPLMLDMLPAPSTNPKNKTQQDKDKKREITEQNAATAAAREDRLAKGKAGKAPAVPVQEEEVVVDNRQELMDRVTRYKERFTGLKSRNKLSGKSTTEEIEDELHYIEQQLGGSMGGGNVGMSVFLGAMHGAEVVTREYFNPLGLNLTGLGQVARDNSAQFTDIVDELMIKYTSGLSMGPEMRLALSVGTLMYTVHAANSGDPKVQAMMQRMSQAAPTTASDL